MACGCNKNARRTSNTPAIAPRNTTSRLSAAVNSQIRPQNSPVLPASNINEGSLNSERRKVQALRREAIRRTLGK